MVRRSAADIEFEIMQSVKERSRSGEGVRAWRIEMDVGITNHSYFKKYAELLIDKGYLKNDNNTYRLTEDAEKTIRYFERKEMPDPKHFTEESILKAMPSNESFKPIAIIKRKEEEAQEKTTRRTQEQLMFDFVRRVKSSEDKGSTLSYINKALCVSPITVIKCGREAESKGYVFTINEVKGGKNYRRFYTTPEGDAWLANTPEKRALSKIDYLNSLK